MLEEVNQFALIVAHEPKCAALQGARDIAPGALVCRSTELIPRRLGLVIGRPPSRARYPSYYVWVLWS